jgi:general secretion pathway protein K
VRNARGIVLILVLWVMMVLTVLAGELARSMRIEGLTTDVYQQDVATYYLATAGLHRALYTILRAQQQGQSALTAGGAFRQPQFGAFGGGQSTGAPGQQEEEEVDVWVRGDGRWKKEEFGEGGYWVRVVDEGGKINLNTAEEPDLRQKFANLKFDIESSQQLVDTILDWRDSDSLVRLHGAENDYYLSLPIPYPAKDGFFHTPEELLLVRGVTPALFYGREGPALRDLFTVYSSGGNGVNLVTASPVVLQAALGMDPQAIAELIQRRTEASGANLAGLFSARAEGGTVNFGLPQIVTIESIGYRNEGDITRRVAAVVQRLGVNNFRFLRWQDRVEGGEKPPQEEG